MTARAERSGTTQCEARSGVSSSCRPVLSKPCRRSHSHSQSPSRSRCVGPRAALVVEGGGADHRSCPDLFGLAALQDKVLLSSGYSLRNIGATYMPALAWIFQVDVHVVVPWWWSSRWILCRSGWVTVSDSPSVIRVVPTMRSVLFFYLSGAKLKRLEAV